MGVITNRLLDSRVILQYCHLDTGCDLFIAKVPVGYSVPAPRLPQKSRQAEGELRRDMANGFLLPRNVIPLQMWRNFVQDRLAPDLKRQYGSQYNGSNYLPLGCDSLTSGGLTGSLDLLRDRIGAGIVPACTLPRT